jgi:hypothetical protein
MKIEDYTSPVEVFVLSGEAWKIRINGEVIAAAWNSKGAAIAGAHVECRRLGIHHLSTDCWCKPAVEKRNV